MKRPELKFTGEIELMIPKEFVVTVLKDLYSDPIPGVIYDIGENEDPKSSGLLLRFKTVREMGYASEILSDRRENILWARNRVIMVNLGTNEVTVSPWTSIEYNRIRLDSSVRQVKFPVYEFNKLGETVLRDPKDLYNMRLYLDPKPVNSKGILFTFWSVLKAAIRPDIIDINEVDQDILLCAWYFDLVPDDIKDKLLEKLQRWNLL